MTHAWALLALYSCASLGTPPVWIMWLPTALECGAMRQVILAGDLPFGDEKPAARWDCRPAEAARESGECRMEYDSPTTGGEGWGS